MSAIFRSQAIVEFTLDGEVVVANEAFLRLVGYALDEIRGSHHSLFVADDERGGAADKLFWDALRRGEPQAAEYRRVGKGGREVWIQASYNPVIGRNGKPTGVLVCATDVTAQTLRNADFEGKQRALDRSQAIIEFAPDGTVLTANENFLAVVGYGLDEVKGRHHVLFVNPAERQSADYARFWDALGAVDTYRSHKTIAAMVTTAA
ncbi:PAS domain-containing protein [Methylobacterium sp. JK268]